MVSAVESARKTRLTAHLVLGVAGAGKTTLVSAALAQVADLGPSVLCRADELDHGVPYSLFADLSHRVRESAAFGGGAADELDEIFKPAGHAEHGDYLFELSRWMRRVFDANALDGLVLVCEDVHNLDTESLRLLASMIRVMREFPCAVILSARPGYDSRTGDLRRLLERMVQFGSGGVLELGPLDDAAIVSLAEDVLDRPIEPAELHELIDRTARNPFLVKQCVELMVRDAVPGRSKGGHDWHGSRVHECPLSSGQLVLSRFFPVIDERLSLAQVLSLFRGTVSLTNPALPRLAANFGLDDGALADLWDQLVASGILLPGPDRDSHSFIHPLLCDALYESIGAGRRANSHQLIAEHLASLDTGARRIFDIATHYFLAHQGGTDLDAADASLQAAAAAEEAATAVTALWLRRSLDLLPPNDPRRATTHLRLIFALTAIWAVADAMQATQVAEEELSGRPEAAWIALPGAIAYLLAGQIARSREAIDTIGARDLDQQDRFWLTSFRPMIFYYNGEPHRASEAYSACAEWEFEVKEETATADALSDVTLGAYCLLTGRKDAYERHFRRCIRALSYVPRALRREITATLAYLDLLGPGRVSEVADLLTGAYDRPLDDRELGLLGPSSATAWTLIHWLRGDLALAQRVAHLAHQEMLSAGAALSLPGVQAVDVLLMTELGMLREARTVASTMESGTPGNHGLVALARARLLCAEGRRDQGELVLRHFFDQVKTADHVTSVASVAEELVRIQVAAGQVTEAQATADEAYAVVVPLNWPLQQMFALRARGIAYQRADLVLQATAICDDLELAFERLMCDLALAEIRSEPDRGDHLDRALAGFQDLGAVRSERMARAVYRRHGLTPPRRPRRVEHRSGPLTATEAQMSNLVAQGLSNRQIAESLFVSVKTVELYLSRIYAKEGVSGRVELTARVLLGRPV